MILPFSTKLNGKPTYFVEKIWKGLKECISEELQHSFEKIMTPEELTNPYQVDGEVYLKVLPKIHTIREDKKDRWKPGTMIDFFINTRTKDMFRFAPRIPVVSIQKIEIERHNTTGVWDKDFTVCIDEHYLNRLQIRCLSENDGFETIEAFFEYFSDTFTGKIIHWTDKKY
jgi:hypothetical protein